MITMTIVFQAQSPLKNTLAIKKNWREFYRNLKHEIQSIIILWRQGFYENIISQKMKACYIEKENDKEAAWNIIESAKPPNIPSQSTYEEHFDTQNQLLSQDNKNKIREKAEAWARSLIERHNANDYIYLYRMGGSYYLVPSN
jgi:hypothetical protein